MSFCTLLLCTSFIVLITHLLHFLKRRKCSKGNLPPGPLPFPGIGNLHKLGDKPNESLAQLAESYGPVMTLKLGSITAVVISSAEMAKEVLQKHDQALSGRLVPDAVRALQHNENSMAWLPAQEQWRKLRTICNTQMFTTKRLDANQGLRRLKVEELIAHVRKHCIEGKAVNIGNAAFVTTLNLISNTVFSVDLVDLNSETAQEFKDLVWGVMEEVGRPNLADYFPLLRALDPQGVRRRTTAYFEIFHSIFSGMIEQRLLSRASSDSPRNDFLDVLLDCSKEDRFQVSRVEINDLLLIGLGDDTIYPKKPLVLDRVEGGLYSTKDIFIAGSETSSSTLEWAMAELLCDPNAMAKGRAEIIETIGQDSAVEESDLHRLPYLQAVVKETLRLHPAAPLLLPHKAESEVEICGYTIPKNTQVIVNAWAIGRDATTWVDPTSFKPERFLGSRVDFKGQDFELIPFGAGRRICPGMPLAARMVHLMLASLLQSFAWKLPDGIAPQDLDMRYKFGITMQKLIALFAIPESY